jgi:hypothetical protein
MHSRSVNDAYEIRASDGLGTPGEGLSISDSAGAREKTEMRIIGMMLLLWGLAGFAIAEPLLVPEINPGSATTALALLSGAVLVIRGGAKK